MRKLILPLTENHLFSKAYTKGKCEVTKYFAVYLLRNYKRNANGAPFQTKLGITVNRKLGKACKRNRVKRMIRQAYRDNHTLIKDGYLMVIAARAAAFAPQVKSTDLSKALHDVLNKENFYDLKATERKNGMKRANGTKPNRNGKNAPNNRQESNGAKKHS